MLSTVDRQLRRHRPLWLIPGPLLPALAFAPLPAGFRARAGPPPPSLRQVLRL